MRVDPFDVLTGICLVLILATPFLSRLIVDNKWRRNMQDRRCGVCGHSWWFHRRNGCAVICLWRKKHR